MFAEYNNPNQEKPLRLLSTQRETAGRAAPIKTVGGKAHLLARAVRLGAPVPEAGRAPTTSTTALGAGGVSRVRGGTPSLADRSASHRCSSVCPTGRNAKRMTCSTSMSISSAFWYRSPGDLLIALRMTR